ncbi:MAG: endonuclease/exonuclease/phosphatase family protein [Alistipes sp.]|nr:endonuclease/exonuclease/phosphatase family protein [Alistipes sp.]
MKYIRILLFSAATLIAATVAAKSREIAYTTPDGEAKIISFNIRQSGLAKKDGHDRWKNRRQAVLNMIQSESPSVIGLQEGLIDQVRYIEQAFPQYKRIGVGRDDGNEKGEITAIFYLAECFEVIESGTFWLSETPDEVSLGWDAACNRTATWVKLREKSTGKMFWYINTHLDHVGVDARENSCRLIADFAAERVAPDETLVVGGDLNSSIDDPIFEPLKNTMLVARDVADSTDKGGTFNSFGSAPSNIVLDHLFFRNAHARSLRTLRGDYGAPYISDHYPVVLLIELQ